MQNVVCSGWLLKTGGDGHNYKNTKRRWFELKGMYLFYFSEQPKEKKEMDVAKGAVYLPGCQVKIDEALARLMLRTSGGKVYYLSVPEEESTADGHETSKLKSWSKAMEYAMEVARGFRDVKVAEGNWLQKRGGKSHGYVNWKKRRFMLRGNLLLYYSEDPELFDVFAHLKGYMDLAAITSIDARENASDEVGKHFYFKIIVDNEREFYIAASSLEQKNAWMKAIRKQTKALAERMHYSNLRSVQKTEKVLVSGEMLRLSKSGHSHLKTYVVLTNVKLRYYENEHDFDIQSFGSHMIGSIPLLGCGTKLEEDGITISLHDLQGHTFSFIGKDSQDADRWMIAIRTASRALITSILSKNLSISLNTYAIGKRGEDLGYTIAKLDPKALTIITLLLDKEKRLEWDEVNKVALKDNKFTLKYTRRRTGVDKTIQFKSANAIAFFDTISCVMSLRDEIEAKERKRLSKAAANAGNATTPKEASSSTSPEPVSISPTITPKMLKRTNSAAAIPISPNMVHQRANNSEATPTSPRGGKQKASHGITVVSASPSSPTQTTPARKKKSLAVLDEEKRAELPDDSQSSPPVKKAQREKKDGDVKVAIEEVVEAQKEVKSEAAPKQKRASNKKSANVEEEEAENAVQPTVATTTASTPKRRKKKEEKEEEEAAEGDSESPACSNVTQVPSSSPSVSHKAKRKKDAAVAEE